MGKRRDKSTLDRNCMPPLVAVHHAFGRGGEGRRLLIEYLRDRLLGRGWMGIPANASASCKLHATSFEPQKLSPPAAPRA